MIYRTKHIAQKTCIAGMMMIFLSACNQSDTEEAVSAAQTVEPAAVASTFDTTSDLKETAPENPEVAAGPVEGIVTVVPGTEPHDPQLGGGEAIPLTGPTDTQIVTPAAEEKVVRFTEIAPDTIGGATFKASPALDYDLGNLVASSSWFSDTTSDDEVFITPIKGQVRYPMPLNSAATAERFPIIVFQHGNHWHEDPSYQGYDYIAQDLAAHGYVVVSINANWINSGSAIDGDTSSQSRAQLILGTLDRLRQIDASGQIDEYDEPGALDPLKNKLDFNRIGLMGHSRGGLGVTYAIKFNPTRLGLSRDDLRASLIAHPNLFKVDYPALVKAVNPATGATPGEIIKTMPTVKARSAPDPTPTVDIKPAIAAVPAKIDEKKFEAAIEKYNIFFAAGRETEKPYDFKAAFMLAPTYRHGTYGINNVPLAVLLPGCDGDVDRLDGSIAYDHNRFGPANDIAPRYQIMVKGANHNYYNTNWLEDDFGHYPTRYCAPTRRDGIRLSQDDQRRSGNFLISSFMRYHVGGEQKFAAYWNAAARLPNAACPSTDGPCDEWVALSVQKGADKRKLIQRFERSDSMERNELGGSFSLSGFDATAFCTMGNWEVAVCEPSRLLDFQYAVLPQGLLSLADHLELVWTKPDASIATDLKGLSAKSYDTLTFRIAVLRPVGQEVNVTLTDNSGKTATIAASTFNDALYNAPRKMEKGLPMTDDPRDTPFADPRDEPFEDEHIKSLLNMVAIPLKAFGGIDVTGLKELKLSFPKESGMVAVTDIELQNFSREAPLSLSARK
ncbi:hypothetical protein GF108_16165 [Phyllobacterium sp. SYP-B3895]|uniref:alpha/beta hydrolase family protein n=1 Tax=Phyllobacterium sp. SYP-B3895 TaxID=2663240 RepID=UPI001299F124|nr:hypothetical protein [Phyllobacterium sp. SYP-B3895]MRG57113.1 hypothetical protein [Phyllobacterium sp. SYP-B3895]